MLLQIATIPRYAWYVTAVWVGSAKSRLLNTVSMMPTILGMTAAYIVKTQKKENKGYIMKSFIFAMILALVPSVAAAYDGDRHYREGWARVINVEEDFHYVTRYVTRDICDRGYRRDRHYRRDSNGNVVGAIIGGVVGSRFGDGNGQIASTIVGAAVGSSIGDRHDRDNRRYRGYDRGRYHDGMVCYTVEEPITEKIHNGWIVEYSYRGRIGVYRSRSYPQGRYVRLY